MTKIFTFIFALLIFSCSLNSPQDSQLISVDDDLYHDGLTTKQDAYEEHFCDSDTDNIEPIQADWSPELEHPEKDYKADSPREQKTTAIREIASVDQLTHLLSKSPCPDMTRGELDQMVKIIQYLGGIVVDPYDYDYSTQGLQEFLNDTGVIERFSAREMVRPHRIQHARTCGHEILLPGRCRWMSAAAQGMIASELRAEINNGNAHGNKPIRLRNWYRPQCYNSKVGGAGQSDHIQARGFDLDFPSARDRARAQDRICNIYKDTGISLQVGIGCVTLHVGVGSPKRLGGFPADGSRYWTYGSLQSCGLKRLSSDDCWVADSRGMRYIHPINENTSGNPRLNL